MVASREMEHRFLLGTNNNSDTQENMVSGSHTFTGAATASSSEKKRPCGEYDAVLLGV